MRRSADGDGCVMPAECRDRSALDPKVEWTRLDGGFGRFPLGVRKCGRITARRAVAATELS